ncbi:unknown protein [Paenibacillus amylolyticus]|uniref:AAA+ ATPase domain-containing protein n=2 Tax=Paenibacillus amylolyticus TaxID=1451 RepID=A0A124DYC1_PAEAM|nr:unknown protein [Paenibacillus amylolyticus]
MNNFVSALLAKPFVILTGSSGTGKTRLALQFAEALEEGDIEKDKNWVNVVVNKSGRIISSDEEEVRDLCEQSNNFTAKFGENNFTVNITMNIQVSSENRDFYDAIGDSDKNNIQLAVAENKDSKRYIHVPVGSDWTDSRNLLGYVNPFGAKGKRVFEISPALKLILKALHPNNRSVPFFLVLDEMNLSHVERYFSTFLSIMEANRSVKSNDDLGIIEKENVPLIAETIANEENETYEWTIIRESAEILAQQGKGIVLPSNVFIIGTVNVDETTYMFSPKVLDRAHVIELQTESPSTFFKKENKRIKIENNSNIMQLFDESIQYRDREGSSEDHPLDLLQASMLNREIYDEMTQTLENLLDGVYKILKTTNFDFGYRIIKEVIEYMAMCNKVDVNQDWHVSLDYAMLQKILPKIHGNKRQIGVCLDTLEDFLMGNAINHSLLGVEILIEKTEIKLEKSLEKIKKMKRNLDLTGYTSFIN